MARRRIGQEQLAVATTNGRGGGVLDETSALIDWTDVDRCLVGIYVAAKGEPAWPPSALLRALLLGIWYDLSDVKLAEALADRASFRRFYGFSATEPTPERTAFVRFRAVLVSNGLDRALFEAITQQLDAKGVAVHTSTLVDATLIPSASIQHDHRRRKPVHGYKAHVATDEQADLIRGVQVTTANVHDAAELDAGLPLEPMFTAIVPSPAPLPSASSSLAEAGRVSFIRAPGAGWTRYGDCRRTMPRYAAFVLGSRKYLAPASAAMVCGGCAGSAWPRRACK